MNISPYITLIRPSNFLIIVASAFVSCILAGGTVNMLTAMIAASFAAGFIGGGGMVVNDIFDIEIDRINKPDRPLASGAISRENAIFLYLALSSVGLLLNLFLHSTARIIALAAFLLIFLYSYKLKGTPFFGNVAVGMLTGLTFIYGGAVAGNVGRAMIPAMFAFLINVGREIIKDMEDIEGDAKCDAHTVPVMFGMRSAAALATLFLIAVICSTFFPFFSDRYGLRYFIIVNAGVNLILGYVLFSLWRNQSMSNLHRLSTILKYDMLVGLVAIYAG